jgi:CubicO group peptidase (beta-lactamase class C family)
MLASLALVSLMSSDFDKDRLALVSARMKLFVADKEVAGVVAMVRQKGKPVLTIVEGMADLEKGVAMQKDTVFQVMSMTKPVTAIAAVICAERGLLNLDDNVDRWLPNLAKQKVQTPEGPKERRRAITVRHLLTHTSGLTGNDPGGLDDDQKRKLTLAEYCAKFGDDLLQSEPGERISYSGPGIAAAGRIVELATGKKLEDFLAQEIFVPLGMKDTTFFAPTSMHPRIALMYEARNGRFEKFDSTPYRPGARYANPAGGLYSTADDMANLMDCLLAGGVWKGKRLLSPAGITSLTTLQSGTLNMDGSEAQGYALGFTVVRSSAGASHFKPIGSFGHTGAFGTEFWGDPKSKMSVVYMAHTWNDRVRKSFNTMVNSAMTKR